MALLAVVFAAVDAGSAAALGKQCSGSSAHGLGAFLQDRAQGRWSGEGELGFNGSKDSLACSGSQGSGGKPTVTYTPLASPAALRAWGAEDGSLHVGELAQPQFLGTDIAPAGPVGEAGTMLAKMKGALGSDVVVVPVTQTAIAIAAHPPALPAHPACTVSRITANQLQRVFNGEITNWRQLATASDGSPGGDCDQAITRIVRDESAGATYQFKHYLDQVNSAPLACTGKEKRTWAQLQAPFGGEAPPNVEWPSNAQCQTGEGHVTTVAGPSAEGESGPLAYVAQTPGTITYGSLPEAQRWAPKDIVKVNNGVNYANPETAEGDANCGAAKYTRPAGWEGGVDVDWSQVYGSNPLIGESAKSAYPICTLTWDIAATHRFSEAQATTVHDYLAFVTGEGGQAAAAHIGYRALPATIAKAAAEAISHIGGVEEKEEEEGGEKEEGGTGTVLCTVAPELSEKGVLDCPAEAGYTLGKVFGTVVPKTVATFVSVAGPEVKIACTNGRYVGDFKEDGTSGGGLFEFEFGQSEGCTTTFPEESEAVVSLENPPFNASVFKYTGAEAPQGTFTIGKLEGTPLLRVASIPTCVYAPGFLSNSIVNGSPSRMIVEGKWELVEGPAEACPAVLAESAQLTFTATGNEEPLYIAGE